jgi:AcrR family transcriptional regulator
MEAVEKVLMPKISDELREERKDAIIQATLKCLADHGYAGTSMRTIAAAAGLTKGGLYAYFASKDAILLELAERYMRRQLSDFVPRVGERAGDALARVLGEYERSPATPEQAQAQRAILDLWTFAGTLPVVREALQQRYLNYVSKLSELVRIGQREGTFRADVVPEHVAALILASRDGTVLHAVKLELPVPAGALAMLLREMLLHYLKSQSCQ